MRRRHRRVELRLIAAAAAAGLVPVALAVTLAHAAPRHRLT